MKPASTVAVGARESSRSESVTASKMTARRPRAATHSASGRPIGPLQSCAVSTVACALTTRRSRVLTPTSRRERSLERSLSRGIDNSIASGAASWLLTESPHAHPSCWASPSRAVRAQRGDGSLPTELRRGHRRGGRTQICLRDEPPRASGCAECAIAERPRPMLSQQPPLDPPRCALYPQAQRAGKPASWSRTPTSFRSSLRAPQGPAEILLGGSHEHRSSALHDYTM
jgi:hypothetical protein